MREADCDRGSGLRQLRRAHELARLPGGGREVAGNGLRRPRGVPQRRVLRPGLAPRRGGQNRAYCSGACTVNSDCGPDQRCTRLVVGNNGIGGRSARRPRDRLLPDDVRRRRQHRLHQRRGAASRSRTARTAATRRTGSAIARRPCPAPPAPARRTARWAANAASGRVSRAATARRSAATPAATSGVNACPGNSTCAQRGGPDEPISACYEKCTPGRDRLQPGERRLRVRIGDAHRTTQRLPGGQRDVSRASPADRDAGCGSGRMGRGRPGAVAAAGRVAAAGVGRHARQREHGRAVHGHRSPPSPPAPVASDAAPAAERLGPVPTADEIPAASDHDAVVGHVGIEARRFDPGPLPLDAAPGVGCPAAGAGTAACEVTMGALAARYWWTRNLALNAGVVFACRRRPRRDRQPRHLLRRRSDRGAVAAARQLAAPGGVGQPRAGLRLVQPGGTGGGADTNMLALRAALEAEVHFGFIGVPALSIGLARGDGSSSTRARATRASGRSACWAATASGARCRTSS